MDRIFCHGITLFAHHGLFDEEARLGQRFEIDIDCYTGTRAADRKDRNSAPVRYDQVYEIVRRTVVDGPRVGLLEELAENIAEAVFDEVQAVDAVRVEVRKPGAPVPGAFKSIGVEISRQR
ncbi:MAG: dihydroneopterin aldolase [Flavobacteriaceae bacterium]